MIADNGISSYHREPSRFERHRRPTKSPKTSHAAKPTPDAPSHNEDDIRMENPTTSKDGKQKEPITPETPSKKVAPSMKKRDPRRRIPFIPVQPPWTDMSSFYMRHSFVYNIWESFTRWRDVAGDGNCGFRVIADWKYGSEEYWPRVRQEMVKTLDKEGQAMFWSIVLGGIEEIEKARDRCDWSSGPVGGHKWFCDTLFPVVSTLYHATVVYLRADGSGPSATYPPYYPMCSKSRPRDEDILYVVHSVNHFVRVDMPPDSPIPPNFIYWPRHRTPEVKDWSDHLTHRMDAWRSIFPPRGFSDPTLHVIDDS